MSRTLTAVVAAVLGSLAVVGVRADAVRPRPALGRTGVDGRAPRLVTVTGEAEVKVVPDEVILTVGVDQGGPDLDRCKSENDSAARKVLEIAAEFGIDPRQIQTSHFNIWPCEYCNAPEKYHVSRTIVITMRDVSRMEDLVSAALKAGMNGIRGISFQTTELRKYRDQARLLALRAAKEKAGMMAAALDERLGRVHEIQEIRSETFNWYDSWWWGARVGGQTQNVVQNAGSAPTPADGTLAPGQISVRATVSVSFELASNAAGD